ncbi:MATE family efflux transporter [Holdemania massiliensis]|uniref:MATE family efflux transporter n=1 Tax=Holdemania massiliensis TaxID=1468449 RepID=UPI001F06C448|nr:MATE family efflux transporter [Holdemania massiliensis]MCH1939715.1 MATE family efflux transporter [Holdemania massiliensis]
MNRKIRNTKAENGDMTTGSPIRLILRFAIPLFIGNIFQQVYTIADTMIAGYNLGDRAIAAIGATSSIYSLLIDFASGMNSGYGIVISRMYGAKDREGMKKSIAAAIVLNGLITLVLTVLSLFAIRPFMQGMNVPDRIFEDAYLYIVIILGGMASTNLYNMHAGILRAIGNSQAPLMFLILSCFINLSLDTLFIVNLGWGVQGAAMATVIAQSCAAVFSGVYLGLKYRQILPERRHFVIEAGVYKDVVTSGMAMAAMMCVVDFGSIIYQRAINGLGESLIAAHTAARRLIGIFMMPLASIATAYSTFVSQNWGAGKKQRVRHSLKNTMFMEIGWGLISACISIGFGTMMVRLLTGTTDVYIIEKSVQSLRFHLICFPALGLLLALRTALQAMGQKIIPILSSSFEFGVKLIAGLWLIPWLGYLCVCVSEPLIWITCTVFLAVVFLIQNPLNENEVKSK